MHLAQQQPAIWRPWQGHKRGLQSLLALALQGLEVCCSRLVHSDLAASRPLAAARRDTAAPKERWGAAVFHSHQELQVAAYCDQSAFVGQVMCCDEAMGSGYHPSDYGHHFEQEHE